MLERFSNDCRKTKTKAITPTNHNRNKLRHEPFLAITCNRLEAREKSRVHGAIGFDFASHWLKNWCESFEPITKRRNRNHVITFDSHLKTALIVITILTFHRRVQGSIGEHDAITWLEFCWSSTALVDS